MCLFITAVILRSALTPELLAVVRDHKFLFEPITNVCVQRQLRADEVYLSTSRNVCDCGSILFSRAHVRARAELERQILKLKRKGWGDSKIKAWVEATEPTQERANQHHRLGRSLGDWASFLDAAIAAQRGRDAYVGVLGHTYRHGVCDEEFAIAGRMMREAGELTVADFVGLQPDVVHEFRRTRSVKG